MAHLAQTLLGSFHLSLDGRPAAGLRASKVRALLLYLTLEPTTAHPRATLANLLWPQSNDKKARQNLRQTVHRLRHALGDDHLLIGEESLQLNTASDSWVDVGQFHALLTAVRGHCPTAPLCPSCLAQLTQAADLYQGELVPSFALDDCAELESWLRQWRERLHQQALALLYTLAAHYLGQQEWELAREYAQRQLAMEPWREEAHRQLMQLWAGMGQQRAALEQYGRCQTILEEELGLPPSAETEQLRREIAAANQPAPTPSQFPAPFPLLGRTADLSHLHHLLRQPDCRALVLLGPAGVGKSALAQQLAHQPPLGRTPLWVSLADVATADSFWEAFGRALGVAVPAVSAVLGQRPWLLILDGLDHLPNSAPLLAHLLAIAPTSQLLLTTRQRPPLAEAHLWRVRGLSTTAADLAENSAAQLFLRVANRVNPSAPLRDTALPAVLEICRQLGGNPLAIQQAASWVRVLSCAAIAAELRHNGRHLLAESSLPAAFEQSWNQLAPAAQAALATLAQFPHSFTHAAATAVADLALPTWAALWDSSLLTQLADGRYHIPPVYRLLAPPQLIPPAEVGARLAYFYAELVAGETAALRGGNLAGAMVILQDERPNWGQAWRWAVAHGETAVLAQMATGLFHFHLIADELAAGYSLLAQTQPAWASYPPALAGLLACYQGWLAFGLGEADGAHLLLQQGLAIAPAPALAAYGAAVAHTLGQRERAWAHIEQSLSATQAQGDWWGAGLAFRLAGQMATQEGEMARGRAYSQQALALARLVGDSWSASLCLQTLGDVAYTVGEWGEAHRCYGEANHLHRAFGDERHTAACLHKLGLVAVATADYGRARRLFEDCLTMQIGLDEVVGQVRAWVQLGRVARAEGAAVGAQNSFHQALQAAVAHQLPHEAVNVLQEVSHLWRELHQQQRPLPPLPTTDQPGDYLVYQLLHQSRVLLHGQGEPAAEQQLAQLVQTQLGNRLV